MNFTLIKDLDPEHTAKQNNLNGWAVYPVSAKNITYVPFTGETNRVGI